MTTPIHIQNLRERVARAIEASNIFGKDWASGREARKSQLRLNARAAIEAIPLNDGLAALFTAEKTQLTKLPDERDTEFVKRIVGTYFAALGTGK